MTSYTKIKPLFAVVALLMTSLLFSSATLAQDDGFVPIFDGKTLDGWKGEEGFWSVKDGTLVGETTAENPLKANTFIIWQGGELGDFELRFKFRISDTERANSGVQFRCTVEPDGHMVGYQADIDRAGQWLGCLYDEKTPRKLLCNRGEKVVFSEDGTRAKETLADAAEILKKINLDKFNDYYIRCVGNHITLTVNGMQTVEIIDNETGQLDLSGMLGLQLHTGPPMKIEFREIRLKKIDEANVGDGANDANDAAFHSLFDGTSLAGWKGDEKLWRVENGAIVGETTKDITVKSNQFLVWENGEVDDFILKLKFKVSGTEKANSGVQVRSEVKENGALAGYQADIDRSGKFIGIIYSERTGRGILCQRGDKTTLKGKKDKTVEKVADPAELLKAIDMDDWNEMEVHAKGKNIVVKINGNVTSEIIDNDPELFMNKGVIGLQLHVGPPMKIEFKDIMLKRLPLAEGTKKVVFIAGKKSHGYGAHEHYAGCMLLADGLNAAAKKQGLPLITTVYKSGWPADPSALDNADTIVVYCDGGGRHYLHHNGEAFEKVMRDGIGLCCIHYGVEVPPGPSGQRFLNWIGGYFETNWSVNPHWVAKFEKIPKHPVTQGVQPFEINDEWYYHMRFSPEMTRVTPLLSALPGKETLSRPDGKHSGNPHVRKAVLEDKEMQHVSWAFVRGDGVGRGFGFTGGHFHNNWQNDNFRKLVLNAIVWTAHGEVPEQGVATATPTAEDLEANQDYPKDWKKPNRKKKKAAPKK